jgi:hypothetical protein
MPKRPKHDCLGTAIGQVQKFLKDFAGRMAETSAIEETIRGIARARGEDWSWVTKWVEEEGPRWVNDMETLVFEVPLENLTGSQSLNFTQGVWMLQPSIFEYQVWDDRGFVRMWWDRSKSAFPGQGTW